MGSLAILPTSSRELALTAVTIVFVFVGIPAGLIRIAVRIDCLLVHHPKHLSPHIASVRQVPGAVPGQVDDPVRGLLRLHGRFPSGRGPVPREIR